MPPPERARVRLELTEHELVFGVNAPFFGDPPPSAPVGGVHGLWDYEVVELFVAVDTTRYLELELGPHGHWVSLMFDGVRRAVSCPVPTKVHATICGRRWTGELRMARAHVPSARAVNACSIHGVGRARRYATAAALPGLEPDFHQPEHFVALG